MAGWPNEISQEVGHVAEHSACDTVCFRFNSVLSKTQREAASSGLGLLVRQPSLPAVPGIIASGSSRRVGGISESAGDTNLRQITPPARPPGTRRARGGPTRQLPSSSQSRRRSVERCPASRRHRPLSFLPWLAREGAAAVGHLFARERERDDCMLIAALIACRWVHLRESERERLSHVAVAVGRPKTNGVFAPRGLLDVRSRPLPAQLLIRKPRSLSPPRAHSRSVCSCYRLAMSDLSASTPDGARHSARPQRLIRLSPN